MPEIRTCCILTASEHAWMKKAAADLNFEAAAELRDFLAQPSPDEKGYDVLLIGDTHLEKPENSRLAIEETEKGAMALLTGRVKKGCCTERLLREGKAFTMAYPHHQSRKDFLEMVGENRFQTVLPFHNNRKEVFWGNSALYL